MTNQERIEKAEEALDHMYDTDDPDDGLNKLEYALRRVIDVVAGKWQEERPVKKRSPYTFFRCILYMCSTP